MSKSSKRRPETGYEDNIPQTAEEYNYLLGLDEDGLWEQQSDEELEIEHAVDACGSFEARDFLQVEFDFEPKQEGE